MSSWKKVIRPMWRKILRMFRSQRPEKLLNRQSVETMSSLHIAVNTRAYENYLPNVRVDIRGPSPLSYAIGIRGTEGRWDVWQKEGWCGGGFGAARKEIFAPQWLFTHIAARESFAPFKEKCLVPVSGQTTGDLARESQGLQWLQTSFRVLNSALDNCSANPDQMITAHLHMTTETLSIQCFNLEISVVFRAEGFMSVVVFDDKNHGSGSAKTPSLEADFASLKPAVLDEFIKLSALVLKAAEARYY